MSEKAKNSYAKRINLICDYIYKHLDQDLSIENLSKVANLSKNNEEELRDFPCFFNYINMFPEIPEHDLITDIYLPLK